MTAVRRPAVTAALLGLVATLLVVVAPPPAADAAEPRPVPAVWDVQPATGEVVAAGTVDIGASTIGDATVDDIEVRVDGEVVDHRVGVDQGTAKRVHATTELPAGEHTASVRFTSGDRRVERTWRFATSDVDVRRLQGPDRYATAARIASAGFDAGSAPAAVLARGDDHADALAGVPLAHQLGGPLLLSERDRLPDVTADALRSLVQAGGTVHLLGGGAALSTEVAEAVKALGFSVRRHSGDDRFGTATAVAEQLPSPREAVLASGISFPDALVAAAPAAQAGQAILLTGPTELPASTRAALQGMDRVVVVGGEAVISRQVAAEVDGLVDRVDRIAGEDRYQTSARVLQAYDLDTSTLGLASGEDFPDALVGALDAARLGTGLLLTNDRRLSGPTRGLIANLRPTALRVYGGPAAVDTGVAQEARAAVTDRGPRVISEEPNPAGEIHSLDQVTLRFSDAIDMSSTSISVWFDGRELPTRAGTGDFDDTLVLTVDTLGTEPDLGRAYPVRVVGAVHDGDGWTHVDRSFTYRKMSMSAGDQGSEVRQLQERLRSLGYWLGTPDGNYGTLTVQAVMAFQKYERLPISGRYDDVTRQRLAVAQRPVPADPNGTHIEIDKNRQVLMFAENGTTRWTFNTSTGSEVPYDEPGGSGTAVTPTGNFTVCHERDYLRESSLGTLWRPKYFQCARGIAVHGATSVPGHPASHGCVRVTYPAMNFIWEQNLMPMGARVFVYGSIPGR